VMLCLAHRYPNIQITGLELQPELVELNQQNILLNEAGHVQVFQGNVLAPPKELVPNSYNHVTTNPPYFEYGSRAYSEDASKMLARHQSEIDLAQWIEACVRMVKPRGYFTMIHRSDRLDDILMELKKKMGGIKIFPLWPTAEEPAKLVLLQARKGVKTPCQLLPGIVLHQSNKAYTPKAEELFRGLGSLDL
jgi:tRNA1(Val) A37 N6-methylase TrmN6